MSADVDKRQPSRPQAREMCIRDRGNTDEVVHITRALSDFFRISLSQGRDWIEVAEELKHLRGYFTIQKVRYRDILDYEIDVPPERCV